VTLQLSAKTARIDANAGGSVAAGIFEALGNPTRLAILRYLGDRIVRVNRIAADLRLASSTATMDAGILGRAGLLHTEMRPARRGLQKVCARTYDELLVDLPRGLHRPHLAVEQTMPVGAYSDFQVEPTCGLVDSHGIVGFLDDPSSFYGPRRMAAQLLWFRSGFVEYRFPNRVPYGARIDALQLSAEVCSEAPLHDPDWPSDLTVWANGVELGAWTCPGDFGGERGRLTPAWWEERARSTAFSSGGACHRPARRSTASRCRTSPSRRCSSPLAGRTSSASAYGAMRPMSAA
jgi:predicted transcriptional regulator